MEYSKASDYSGEKYRDCYHDRDLVTINKNGCSIHGMNFNPNIRYNLELFDIDHPSNNPISTIGGFEPREYRKWIKLKWIKMTLSFSENNDSAT